MNQRSLKSHVIEITKACKVALMKAGAFFAFRLESKVNFESCDVTSWLTKNCNTSITQYITN